MSSEDPFEELANLNSKAYDEGFREGEIDGKKSAVTNGFKIGKAMAFGVAKDLGECQEICSLYLQNQLGNNESKQEASSTNVTEKCSKLSKQILELIDRFDLEDCHSETFQSNYNFIKDKFKQFCSLANVKCYSTRNDINFKMAANPKLSF